MNITGLDKAAVLAALFNNSKQQGRGVLDSTGIKPMTIEEAREEIEATPSMSFDYLRGRVMKVDLKGDELDTWLYNRDNGEGAAETVLFELIKKL